MNKKTYFIIFLLLLFSVYLTADIKFTDNTIAGLKQNATINLSGNFLNYGNLDLSNGSISFFGSGASALYGRFNIDMQTLSIDKSSGTLTIYSYFTVNRLVLKNGTIDAWGTRSEILNLRKKGKNITFKNLLKNEKLGLLSNKKTSRSIRSNDFLKLADNANIYRYSGSLGFSPDFLGGINVYYYNPLTTGYELPDDNQKIKKLTLNIDSGSLTLSKDIKINELLSIENGAINTSGHTITMAENAPIEGQPSDITGNIVGETQSVGSSSYTNSNLGFSLSSGNNIGSFWALLYKSAAQIGNHQGILRQWKFWSTNQPQNRNLTFTWDSSADNHQTLPNLQIYKKDDNQDIWYAENSPSQPTTNPRNLVYSNISDFGLFTISDAIINSDTDQINFADTWIGSSSTQQFTITNYQSTSFSGTVICPDYITITTATRSKNDFISLKKIQERKTDKKFVNQTKDIKKTRNQFSFNIAANSQLTFTATFSPTNGGTFSDDIVVKLNTTNYPSKKIAFTATAKTPPTISYSPSSFTDTLATDTTSSDILTLSNSGEDDLSYTASVSYSRNDVRSSVNVYPNNADYWTGTCTTSSKTQNSIVEAHYQTAGWMKFDISSIPSGVVIDSVVFHGYVNDTNWPYWSITPVSNDPVSTDAATLNSDIRDEASSGYYLHQNESGSFATGWKTYTLGGDIVSDVTNSLSQGWFAIGIASRDNSDTYYIKFDGWNETNKPYLTIAYHTTSSNWLSLNSSNSVSGNISPAASENITVGFDTSGLNDGTYQATININSNDPNNSNVSIPVTLYVATPQISVNPASLDFGEVIIGDAPQQTFTITNDGTATLSGNITAPAGYTVGQNSRSKMLDKKSLSLSGSFNRRNTISFSINASSSEIFTVTFEPTQETTYSGNIIIDSNAETSPTNISVTGTGVAVNMQLSAQSFEKTLSLNQTATDNLVISTTGQGTLTYTAQVNYPSSTRSIINVYPDNQSRYTGSCNDSTITETSLVKGYNDQDGWFKFDISAIPDSSLILSVTFHGYVNSTYYPWWSLTPLSVDPQTADPQTLHPDIEAEANSGYYLKSDENSSFSTGWKSYDLKGNICTDLQNALSQDWFAMGMCSRDNSTSYYIDFDGWNEANKPYLTIEYAPPGESWVLINGVYTVQGSVTESTPDTLHINFDSSGLSVQDYSANINITSNDPNNSEETLPVTLHVIQNLQTPQNVEIAIEAGYISISWDDSGASSYKVYSCDTPNGTFTDVTSSGSFVRSRSRITWKISESSQGVKKFYKITASDESPSKILTK